jgi:hypothetical protein
MPTDSIQIIITGQEHLFASLDAFTRRTEVVIGLVAPQLYGAFAGHVAEQFGAEGGRTGERWELSEAYAKAKAKSHPGKPAMQREGKLLASLTDRNADGAVYDVQPDSAVFGSSLTYALYQLNAGHDLFGGRDEDADEYRQIIASDLTAYAKDLGFRA